MALTQNEIKFMNDAKKAGFSDDQIAQKIKSSRASTSTGQKIITPKVNESNFWDTLWSNLKKSASEFVEPIQRTVWAIWWAVKWAYEWVNEWISEWGQRYWEWMVSDAEKVNRGDISQWESLVRWAGRTAWYIWSDIIGWTIWWAIAWWFKWATTQQERDNLTKWFNKFSQWVDNYTWPYVQKWIDYGLDVYGKLSPQQRETAWTVWQWVMWATDILTAWVWEQGVKQWALLALKKWEKIIEWVNDIGMAWLRWWKDLIGKSSGVVNTVSNVWKNIANKWRLALDSRASVKNYESALEAVTPEYTKWQIKKARKKQGTKWWWIFWKETPKITQDQIDIAEQYAGDIYSHKSPQKNIDAINNNIEYQSKGIDNAITELWVRLDKGIIDEINSIELPAVQWKKAAKIRDEYLKILSKWIDEWIWAMQARRNADLAVKTIYKDIFEESKRAGKYWLENYLWSIRQLVNNKISGQLDNMLLSTEGIDSNMVWIIKKSLKNQNLWFKAIDLIAKKNPTMSPLLRLWKNIEKSGIRYWIPATLLWSLWATLWGMTWAGALALVWVWWYKVINKALDLVYEALATPSISKSIASDLRQLAKELKMRRKALPEKPSVQYAYPPKVETPIDLWSNKDKFGRTLIRKSSQDATTSDINNSNNMNTQNPTKELGKPLIRKETKKQRIIDRVERNRKKDLIRKNDSWITKDLQPLYDEARKYKSADEFAEVYQAKSIMDLSDRERHKFGRLLEDWVDEDTMRYMDAKYTADIYWSRGNNQYKRQRDANVPDVKSPDDIVTIYRWTVKSQNKIEPWDFVTFNKDYALSHNEWAKLITLKVPAKDVVRQWADFSEWIYSPEKLRWGNKYQWWLRKIREEANKK